MKVILEMHNDNTHKQVSDALRAARYSFNPIPWTNALTLDVKTCVAVAGSLVLEQGELARVSLPLSSVKSFQ